MTLLDLNNITAGYGRLTALRGVSLHLDAGETLFITGPNGAGKSTLLKTIAGVVTPRSGSITLSGRSIAGQAPETIARLGLSMVPEGRDVFTSLSVDENLRIGTGMRRDRDQVARDLEQIYALFPVLKERRQTPGGLLSGGQQQMLVIARALMTAPRLIAIDEPSLGLAPKVTDEVYAGLIRLRDDRGLTLLIVEQSATRALVTGGRMVLLRNGQIALTGDARTLANSDALKQAYFGTDEAQP